MSSQQLILLSGGLDSVVLADRAAEQGGKVCAMYFSSSPRLSLGELGAARYAASRLHIPLEVVDIQGIARMLIGHAPPEWIVADEADTDPDPDEALPTGYHVLVSIATYYAQVRGIKKISVGLLREQADHRPGLADFLEQWPSLVRTLNDSHAEFRVEAPLLEHTKAEVVKMGVERGVDLAKTWSCFRDGLQQCGVCNSCRSRRAAFEAAGVEDPTLYDNM